MNTKADQIAKVLRIQAKILVVKSALESQIARIEHAEPGSTAELLSGHAAILDDLVSELETVK